MLRQAIRKAPRKTVGKSIKRTASKKRTAANKAAATSTTSFYIPKMKTFINNLGSFIAQRKKEFSANDPICKRLNTIHTALLRELKKTNPLNAVSAKHMKALVPSLRGVSKLPSNIKGQIGKLLIFIRSQVNKDVLALIKNFKSLLNPLQTELNKINKNLSADIKKAATKHIQWKIDPVLKKRINALNASFNRYRTKWFNRLNKMNLYGNTQIKSQVNSLKNQINEIQKLLKTNQTIVNRYAKTPKPRKGFKTQFLMNANQMKTIESKVDNIETACENVRMKVEHFWDQLKAIKLF